MIATILTPARAAIGAISLAFLVLPALAETRPTLNLYGSTGLIDMPSGEAQPDGMLNVTSSHFGPISRTTLSFQMTERMSGSFRYAGIRDWNKTAACQPKCTGTDAFETYYDRSFDLRYQILKEGRYLPSITVGLQDFVGTGVLAGEYVTATKNLTPDLKVTAGLGWGRLGSYGSIGSPFGERPPLNIGRGGKFDAGQWFRGPAAPFAGVEWQVNDALAFKAEYSSDAYDIEAGTRGTFSRKSPFNFGVEYKYSDHTHLGAYYMYGSEVGIAAHFFINPKNRPTGAIRGGAPTPVAVRPSRQSDPDAYDPGWMQQDTAAPIIIKNLNKKLIPDGIEVEEISYSGMTARVTVSNTRYDSEAQLIGRVSRAMAGSLPASVEVFEIVPLAKGLPVSKVTVRRRDLETLEFAPDASAAMQARIAVSDAEPRGAPGVTLNPDRYPRFRWNLGPYVESSLFDPDSPIRADAGARLSFNYDLAPGLAISGSATKKLIGNRDQSKRLSNSVLPRVRTDGVLYDKQGDPAIETLALSLHSHPTETLYTRVTAGYLERMFAGVSAEVLWKRVDSPFALGVEVNYVKQRDYDQLFGLRDYSVLTGHVSGYYTFAGGYQAQLDVGRYLAGDVGATLSVSREFESGWKVGAFATKTNVSADRFGEGSFDKGITVSVPMTWLLGTPTASTNNFTLRPIMRDGGARLNVDDRLYDTVRGHDKIGLDNQWGRFWR